MLGTEPVAPRPACADLDVVEQLTVHMNLLRIRDVLLDKVAALAAISWFGLSIAQSISAIRASPDSAASSLVVLVHIANVILLGLIILALAFRRRLVLRAQGPWPRLAGLLGFVAPLALAFTPRTPLHGATAIVSASLMFTGTLGATWAVLHLGRAFSVLPQARDLVTSGPYRFVRHPMYAAELIAVAGVMMEHVQPWATLVYLLAAIVQLPRIAWEERILTDAFPAYAEYKRRTARLVPLVY